MNTLYTSLFIIFVSLITVNAAGTCSTSISARARSGSSWTSQGVEYQLYDIIVNNTGSCPVTSVFGLFGFPATGSISQSWNYITTTGEITNFGGSLAPGQVSGSAGFVLAGGVTPTLTINTPRCPESCTGPSSSTGGGATTAKTATTGGASTTSVATSTTGSTTSTAAPTAAPTTCGNATCRANQVCIAAERGPTCFFRSCSDLNCTGSTVCINDGGYARCVAVGGSCSVGVVVSARANAAFLYNGVPSQIYDLDISNTGSRAVTALVIEIVPVTGTQVAQDNKWNLALVTGNQYTVATFGGLSAPGSHYYGAGFVLSGTSATTATPTVRSYNVTCL